MVNPALTPGIYRKLHANHDARELRRGLESLRKRVDKHFGEISAEEAESGSGTGDRSLLVKVSSACETRYIEEIEKVKTLPPKMYGEEAIQGIVWNVTEGDINRWFKGGR